MAIVFKPDVQRYAAKGRDIVPDDKGAYVKAKDIALFIDTLTDSLDATYWHSRLTRLMNDLQ